MKSKVVAFIPLKLNNERLPGKNTMAFDGGNPLVQYILKTALAVSLIDEIYVYCSDESIINYFPTEGGIRFLKRGKHLDLHTTSINEVIGDFAKDVNADIYVLLHATAPFLKEKSVSAGITAVLNGSHDCAFSVTRHQEFLWTEGRANYDVTRIPRTQDLEPFFVETTGMYVFTKHLASMSCRIGAHPFFVEVSQIEAIDINYEIDFQIANAIFQSKLT